MKAALLLVVLAGPLAADEVWVLESGPSSVDAIPLKPVQPVDAWRGQYDDGAEQVWLYATNSPHFFAPALPEVRRIAGSAWTVAVFFPEPWTAARRASWLDAWQSVFVTLTFPQPGWPIVFPSVLRLPALTKG